jgi:DNA-binding XRE family transcriptional regulator
MLSYIGEETAAKTVSRMKNMHEADISKLVKNLRAQLGLTQEQFAQKVGVTYSTVNHWENGKRMPQPFLARRLLELKDEIAKGGSGGHAGTSRSPRGES